MKFSIRTHGKAINHLAWGVVRKYGMTWKDAYAHAIKALSMKDRLTTGVVEFSFTKLDGTHMDAKGTRDLNLITAAKHPKGTSTKPETTNVVGYFDLAINEWRSFDITTLNPA